MRAVDSAQKLTRVSNGRTRTFGLQPFLTVAFQCPVPNGSPLQRQSEHNKGQSESILFLGKQQYSFTLKRTYEHSQERTALSSSSWPLRTERTNLSPTYYEEKFSADGKIYLCNQPIKWVPSLFPGGKAAGAWP